MAAIKIGDMKWSPSGLLSKVTVRCQTLTQELLDVIRQ